MEEFILSVNVEKLTLTTEIGVKEMGKCKKLMVNGLDFLSKV